LQDPYNLVGYLAYNPFLPDINNEKAVKSMSYKANLASLDKLVLFRFSQDVIVVPRDSAWFSFFDGEQLVGLKDSPLYKVLCLPDLCVVIPTKPFFGMGTPGQARRLSSVQGALPL
jgi:hypothetical protein